MALDAHVGGQVLGAVAADQVRACGGVVDLAGGHQPLQAQQPASAPHRQLGWRRVAGRQVGHGDGDAVLGHVVRADAQRRAVVVHRHRQQVPGLQRQVSVLFAELGHEARLRIAPPRSRQPREAGGKGPGAGRPQRLRPQHGVDDAPGQFHRVVRRTVEHQDEVQPVRRHGQHLARAADHAAGVVDDLHAAVVVAHQAQRVGQRLAVVQLRRLQHLAPGVGGAHPAGCAQVSQPRQHVVHRRDHRAVAAEVRHRQVAAPPAAVGLRQVQLGQPRQQHVVVGQRDGLVHAQGLEDARAQHLLERHAGRALDHLGQQLVAAVAVEELAAGPEVQRRLPQQRAHHGAGRPPGHAAGQRHQVEMAARARGVGHQLAQRGLRERARPFGQEAADRGVDLQQAVLGQQQRGQAGEVLAGGADAHAQAGPVGRAKRHAGQPPAPAQQHAPVLRDAHHHARRVGPRQRLEQREQRLLQGVRCLPRSGHVGGGVGRGRSVHGTPRLRGHRADRGARPAPCPRTSARQCAPAARHRPWPAR